MTTAVDELQDCRSSLRLTQQELAWAFNTTQATVSRWLSADRVPGPEVRWRLARWASAADTPFVVTDPENRRGPVIVPDGVWTAAFAPRRTVRLPLHLDWSGSAADRVRDVSTRSGRTAMYQQVLTEGSAADIVTWVDLVELAATIDDRVWSRRHQSKWREVLRQRGFLWD